MRTTVSSLERLTRRAWGLPCGSGFYAEHPCRRNAKRVPGYLECGAGLSTTLHQKDSWDDVESATRPSEVKHTTETPHTSKQGGPREFENRVGHDFHVHSRDSIINSTSGGGVWEGRDDCLRSVSLAEDVWHVLTVDMSLFRLLLLEIVLEFLMMFASALVLTLIGACDGVPLGGTTLLHQKMLLAFTTVRISSDSIYGWQEKTPSTNAEIFTLALLGWLHWLLLSVAGAVIVARALKPLQQVAFAPDCVYDDSNLSIRMMVLRKDVILYDLQVRIQAFAGGEIYDLPISTGTGGYARWTGVFPLTMKHKIDDKSPLRKDFTDMNKITNIAVTVTAIDSDGKPVFGMAEYYNPRGWVANRPEFQGWFNGKPVYPRMLRGKFGDQFRFFKVPNDERGLRHAQMESQAMETKTPVTGPPVFLLDFDNFHVVHNEIPPTNIDSPV